VFAADRRPRANTGLSIDRDAPREIASVRRRRLSGQTTGSGRICETSSDGVAIRPFPSTSPDEDLTDLAARPRRVALPDTDASQAWQLGHSGPRQLIGTDHDCARSKERFKALPHFHDRDRRVDVQLIHVRFRSTTDALPLGHAWVPGVDHSSSLISSIRSPTPPEARVRSHRTPFHLVIPSMPATDSPGNRRETGLETRFVSHREGLGLADEAPRNIRYSGAQGGDWGIAVSSKWLCSDRGLLGIHNQHARYRPARTSLKARHWRSRAIGPLRVREEGVRGGLTLLCTYGYAGEWGEPPADALWLRDSPVGLRPG